MKTVRDEWMKSGGREKSCLALINHPPTLCDVRKGSNAAVMVN